MSTILPEEPVVPDRESVILSNAERRYLRRKLKDSLAVTRDVLNPRNQLRRLVERQTTQAKQIADETVQVEIYQLNYQLKLINNVFVQINYGAQ